MNRRRRAIGFGVGDSVPLEGSTLTVLLLGFLTTLGFMLYAGEPSKSTWWLFFVPFAGWAGAPYAITGLAVRRSAASRASQVVLLLTAIALTGFGCSMLYTAFVTHIDAQSGIVFVFLPVYQLMGLVPLLLIAQHLARRASR